MRTIRFTLAVLLAVSACDLSHAQTPTPLHAYELNNSLADTYGGPALTNNGASLGATGLTFGVNQGPSLANWLGGSATSGNYSIEMYFNISDTTGYRKLIDFQGLASDTGLYNLDTVLNFYPFVTSPTSTILNDVFVHLVLTRDGGSSDVVGYINGNAALGIAFNDAGNDAVFGAANNVIHFFQDDTVTTGNEASSGFVDFIRVYDRAISSTEAAALFAAVPEPTTYLTVGSALMGVGMIVARRRRTRRRQTAK